MAELMLTAGADLFSELQQDQQCLSAPPANSSRFSAQSIPWHCDSESWLFPSAERGPTAENMSLPRNLAVTSLPYIQPPGSAVDEVGCSPRLFSGPVQLGSSCWRRELQGSLFAVAHLKGMASGEADRAHLPSPRWSHSLPPEEHASAGTLQQCPVPAAHPLGRLPNKAAFKILQGKWKVVWNSKGSGKRDFHFVFEMK